MKVKSGKSWRTDGKRDDAVRLDATTLGRTASVVGKRSYVNDFSNFDACAMNGTDS